MFYCRWSSLKQLQELNLSGNNFQQLPPVIYKLSALKTLRMGGNRELKRIEEQILDLTKLEFLECNECLSLEYPPYAVCKQGLFAVKKFFIDFKNASDL